MEENITKNCHAEVFIVVMFTVEAQIDSIIVVHSQQNTCGFCGAKLTGDTVGSACSGLWELTNQTRLGFWGGGALK